MSLAGRGRTWGAEGGFTVIELAVAMALIGVMLTLATPGWRNYQANQEHVSASRELVSTLRNAQLRATAEETSYRVDVDAATRTLTVYRYDGAGYVQLSVRALEGVRLRVDEATFTDKLGATTASAYFYPRGTASPGKIILGREGRTVQKVVTVEGLTGRVSTT